MEQGCVTVSRDRTRKRRRDQSLQERAGETRRDGLKTHEPRIRREDSFVGGLPSFFLAARLLCDQMSSLWLPFRSTSNNGHTVRVNRTFSARWSFVLD